ncbi:DNA methyltransferase [Actinomadura decatromicini]|uniref:site-specific DNA-methyltransferase (cytosine-N(4)-specific) n=1 Tax=Actinomadura decatromicini TaxID=2604572 RepID=A0A5D3FXD5_9ACTN|nr:DNA methyltransferase [Actinomadura decatromicini]TYK52566.1 DNA methyltransferase [Actinomadura decatromicini]
MTEQRGLQRRNAHLTHKANMGVGRHGWLRLTPAYSVRLVRDRVQELPPDAVVSDPFSGTGTTTLAAVEHGCTGQSLDVNPFLVWLGNAKVRHYSEDVLAAAADALAGVLADFNDAAAAADGLWEPRLHKIERWWPERTLAGLKALRHALDLMEIPQEGRDLLDLAFCRTVIGTSNAAFNHQSMSFKKVDESEALLAADRAPETALYFRKEARDILAGAAVGLPGSGTVILSDSRAMESPESLKPCDLLLTSPPYVNRMSYIRELRPYMYWLRFLDQASDAGELDWKAIGGTWGIATSRLNDWSPDAGSLPIDGELKEVRALIERDGGKNGPLLSAYVAKYFHDMRSHFEVAFKHIKNGGRASYIVGNSTFYGHLVPAEQWYATMMREVGFTDVKVTTIRKRNSNKALYEYDVTGRRP